MNNADPIAIYSEQSGKHWKKNIRNFKCEATCRAHQQTIEGNTKDIFARTLLKSHPNITLKRWDLKCFRCNLFGHTARSCKSTMQANHATH